MKRRLLSIFLLFSFLECGSEVNKDRQPRQIENEFSTVSAAKAIEIAETLAGNDRISEAQWESLFKSAGYKNYLIYADSTYKKQLIRKALITVFDPECRDKLDSLLAIPLQMDQNYFRLSLIRNFYGLKHSMKRAKEFLNSTDFKALMTSGDSLAREYLPNSIKDALPDLYDVHFIMSDPDAKVMDDAIVFDLNMALEKGADGLIKIIAHEYHHAYRKLTAKSYVHPLMIQLNKVHQEGVADLIDKDEPPIVESGLYPMAIIDAYNADYAHTPKNLEYLDTLTNRYLRQAIDSTTYFDQINSYFRFGGHTAGYYMSSKIKKALSIDVLIESYNNPVEFIRIYNRVAEGSSVDHVFSPAFIRYIELLDKQVTTKPTMH